VVVKILVAYWRKNLPCKCVVGVYRAGGYGFKCARFAPESPVSIGVYALCTLCYAICNCG